MNLHLFSSRPRYYRGKSLRIADYITVYYTIRYSSIGLHVSAGNDEENEQLHGVRVYSRVKLLSRAALACSTSRKIFSRASRDSSARTLTLESTNLPRSPSSKRIVYRVPQTTRYLRSIRGNDRSRCKRRNASDDFLRSSVYLGNDRSGGRARTVNFNAEQSSDFRVRSAADGTQNRIVHAGSSNQASSVRSCRTRGSARSYTEAEDYSSEKDAASSFARRTPPFCSHSMEKRVPFFHRPTEFRVTPP